MDFFNSFMYIWNKWDADHYLFIAQNWYINQGDKKFLIVFYPLYPIIIKLINPLIHNYFLSGIIVSNLSLSAACFYLYKLTKLDFGEDIALSSVKYFLFFPASFFLGATFSESLFIALSVMTLYFCRKDKWIFAGLCGFLASLTRSLGILLIIPVVIEFLISCRIVQNLARKKFYVLLRTESAKGLPLLLIPMSLLVYLYINKTVTGDWLKFLEYQKEHWHQSFGLFFENIKNFILNIDTWNPKDSASLWIPQSAIIFFSLILVPFGFKRIRASYMAYAFVYLFVSISPTWLLSGPRYIMGIFPIYIILSLLSQSRVIDVILTFVSVISLCYCTLAFVSGNLIM